MARRRQDQFDRLMQKVLRQDSCWLWTASKLKSGYGQFMMADGSHTTAHRAMWIMIHGVIADGLFVCHKCDNPSCVNPAHLFLGNHQENMDDCGKKGRHSSGESRWNARLKAKDIPKIRSLFAEGRTAASIARMFGVNSATVRDIKYGDTWKQVI